MIYGEFPVHNTEGRQRRVRTEREERQKREAQGRKAISLVETIRANVANGKLTDEEFREFVRRSLED